MIKILYENIFETSIWYKKLYKGLTDELKKRRILYQKAENADGITPEDTIYIIGTNYMWLNDIIKICNQKHITPVVLCNQASNLIQGRYHCVTTDASTYIRHIMISLKSIGITKIALYGVNESSVSDRARMQTFTEMNGYDDNVFMNNGSLNECFLQFINNAQKYDAVICVNNYAAISLAKNLSKSYPEMYEKLKIISCTACSLETAYSKHITYVSINYEQYGKAALSLSEMAAKNPYISDITVTIQWNYNNDNIFETAINEKEQVTKSDTFYDDFEVQRLIAAENILAECDKTDIQILKMLANGNIYDDIAEKCFLSKGSIKYRIKKLLAVSGAKNKKEMLDIMSDFYPFTASGETNLNKGV